MINCINGVAMENKFKFVLLHSNQNSDNYRVLEVLNSLKELSTAVDVYIKYFPNSIFVHHVIDGEETIFWDWCCIPFNADNTVLSAGGGSVPKKLYWGKNLVNNELDDNDVIEYEELKPSGNSVDSCY